MDFMKIAMFTDAFFPRINGVTVSVNSFAEALVALGHEVYVVCLEYSKKQQKNSLYDIEEKDKELPFKILRVPSAWVPISKEDRTMRLDKCHRITKVMDEFKPDVIHINSEFTVGYFGSLYCKKRSVPFVYTFHTMWEDYAANYLSFAPEKTLRNIARRIVKFYLKRADLIIAPTKRIAQVVKDYGIDRQTEILPTGIPDSKLNFIPQRDVEVKSLLKEKFPELEGREILLFVGRIVKEKNLSFLYDVLENVQKECPKAALLFVGGGPYLEELQDLAKERGLEKSVFFAGYMDGEDLIYLYKMARVFTFPSKTETQGLVTVEAMLSGLPVVAIGQMGTVDVMQGDNGGFMVNDDVEEFSQKTILLLKDKVLRKQKSEEAVAWAEKWKISVLVQNLVACYEKAIASHPKVEE